MEVACGGCGSVEIHKPMCPAFWTELRNGRTKRGCMLMDKAIRFKENNEHLYDACVSLVEEAYENGKRFSMHSAYDRVRWDPALKAHLEWDDDFRMTAGNVSWWSRFCLWENPHLIDTIEIRALRCGCIDEVFDATS